jgi:hypothetical protein
MHRHPRRNAHPCTYLDLDRDAVSQEILDRLHFYLPGWDLPKMRNEFFTGSYGLVVDYPDSGYITGVQVPNSGVVGRLPTKGGQEHFGLVLRKGNTFVSCLNKVLAAMQADGTLKFRGDSDAHIVRGLIAILLRLFSGRPPEAILAFDAAAAFETLGLKGALSQQRSNGLASMAARIRRDAEIAAAA